MAKYRTNLPQLNGDKYVTDGGLETTLVFDKGLDLPEFAAFDLLKNDYGYELFNKYYSTYAAIAKDHRLGFILDSFTWRASSAWGEKLGYSNRALADVNRTAIGLLHDIRNKYENEKTRMVISGCIGPRGDGYNPTDLMSEEEAQRYHTIQIETLSEHKLALYQLLQ